MPYVAGLMGNLLTYTGWTNSVDADTLKTGAIYMGEGCINVPAQYCMILTLGTGDRTQIAISRATGRIFYRTAIPGGWKSIATQ